MGMPGRLTVWTSRVAAPVAMNPVKTIAAIALAGGVLTAARLADSKLRQMRMERRPYEPRRRWLRRTGRREITKSSGSSHRLADN